MRCAALLALAAGVSPVRGLNFSARMDDVLLNASRILSSSRVALHQYVAAFQSGSTDPHDFSLGPNIRGSQYDLATGGRAAGFQLLSSLCTASPMLGHGVTMGVDGLMWWMPCTVRGPFGGFDSSLVLAVLSINDTQACSVDTLLPDLPPPAQSRRNLTVRVADLLAWEWTFDDREGIPRLASSVRIDESPVQATPGSDPYMRTGMLLEAISGQAVVGAAQLNATLAALPPPPQTVTVTIRNTPTSCQSWASHWYVSADWVTWAFDYESLYRPRGSSWYRQSYTRLQRPYFTHVYPDRRCQCPVVSLATALYKANQSSSLQQHQGVFTTDVSLAPLTDLLKTIWSAWVADGMVPFEKGGLFVAERSGLLVASTAGITVSCASCFAGQNPERLSAFDYRAGPTVTGAALLISNGSETWTLPELPRGEDSHYYGRVDGGGIYARVLPLRGWDDPEGLDDDLFADGIDWVMVMVLQGNPADAAWQERQDRLAQLRQTSAPDTPAPALSSARRSTAGGLAALAGLLAFL